MPSHSGDILDLSCVAFALYHWRICSFCPSFAGAARCRSQPGYLAGEALHAVAVIAWSGLCSTGTTAIDFLRASWRYSHARLAALQV